MEMGKKGLLFLCLLYGLFGFILSELSTFMGYPYANAVFTGLLSCADGSVCDVYCVSILNLLFLPAIISNVALYHILSPIGLGSSIIHALLNAGLWTIPIVIRDRLGGNR